MTVYVHEVSKVWVYDSGGVGGFWKKIKKVVLGFALTAPLPEWKWDSLLAVLLTQTVVLKSLKDQTFHSGTLILPPNPVNTQILSHLCKVTQQLPDFEIII